jgi:hypothetical protein
MLARDSSRKIRGMSAAVEPLGHRVVRPESARARAWNQRVWAVVRPDTLGPLPFFCECGMEYCRSSVWLTLEEATEVIERGGLIIGGHFRRDLEAHLGRATPA